MTMKRVIQSLVLVAMLIAATAVQAQYEDESFIEAYIGGNYTIPNGYIKNDLVPDSLNAKGGLGLDVSVGYYMKPKLILGVYFNNRNLGVEGLNLNHRSFELGLYGKYLFMDMTEARVSPYLKLSGGINFSNLATVVFDDGISKFRELSYDPTLGTEGAIGLHLKTNSYGGLFFEAGYHMDFTDDIIGSYEGTDYTWGGNNNYLIFRAGVLFNIGPKD